jgi:tRNA 2-thiocytidine biosynthesis protein TtcA
MKLQQMYSLTRKAIDDFQMIEENDCIALGISGGKDSMALLYILAGLKNFIQKNLLLLG